MSWKIQYNNAKKIIAQIKNGEWDDNSILNHSVKNTKYPDIKLWIGNGGFYTDIIDSSTYCGKNAFGYIFRHWVYYHIKQRQKSKLPFEL